LATVDGGASWMPQTANTTNQLFAVSMPSAEYGWAVGNAGTIDAYVNDTTPPAAPSIDSGPGAAGTGETPSWSFSGERAATFECRLDRGATQISDWSDCSDGTASFDLTSEQDGTYRFSVRATDRAGNTGTSAISDYRLDTTAPAAPSIGSPPSSPGADETPTWSFSGEAG